MELGDSPLKLIHKGAPDLLEGDLIETSGQPTIVKIYVYNICGSLIGQMKKLQVKPFSSWLLPDQCLTRYRFKLQNLT